MSTANWRLNRVNFGRVLIFGLAVFTALEASKVGAEESSKAKPGQGPAYDTLGHLVIMHDGRRKPLDTVARQEVKLITGRQSFELFEPETDDKPLGKWQAAAAFFGWSADPDYWDDQRFILVEYLPLKEMLLADEVKALLTAIAGESETAGPLKKSIEGLVKADRISAQELKEIARHSGLPEKYQGRVESLAHRLGAEGKFVSPRELEEAYVVVDGKRIKFFDWYGDIAMRNRPDMITRQPPVLPTLEKKVTEVSSRLARYQIIRGDHGMSFMSSVDHIIPRPNGADYLAYVAASVQKYEEIRQENSEKLDMPLLDRVKRDKQSGRVFIETASGRELPLEQFLMVLQQFDFNEVERDALDALIRYYSEHQQDDRLVPGTDDAHDEEFRIWLAEDDDWAPLKLILEGDADELNTAGYPSGELANFRAAYKAAVEAEIENPGRLPIERAEALVLATRELADSVNTYPTSDAVGREVQYNQFAPFYKAPYLYGLGFLALGLCLSFRPEKGTALNALKNVLYVVGMTGLIGGIGLEIYGFYLRVMISGWAPVTNLYETVVWVALVTAVIGLILELLYRRVYAAAAASGVAMLCTIIAANATSVLNPNIEALQPVLRSNYWLTIHVLTIVSSYAAFALAMGLGLIATFFYLTATYKRDVSIGELAFWLVPGIPLTVGGLLLAYPGTIGWTPSESAAATLFYGGWFLLATPGIAMTVTSLGAMLGEIISRSRFAMFWASQTENSAVVGASNASSTASADAAQMANASASAAGGGTATLTRPTVEMIRARSGGGNLGSLPPREQSMQETAGRIKPLSSFIYRALQVGVLLVAAGTILGGVWADYSWGRFWGWDPKEVSALVTLLVYLIPLHGRFAGWVNTFGLVCFSVLCFNSVLMAWYGVNFLLGVGLHSYGFAEGGNQGVVLLSALVVSSLVFSTIWRRSLAYRHLPAA